MTRQDALCCGCNCVDLGMFRIIYLLSSLAVWYALPLSAQVINEIQSSNLSTIADEDADYPDWIELHNPSPTPIHLSGFGLSDNPNSPFKWTFPSVTLSAGAYLVVFASGKDRRDATSNLHTNFSLSAEGESVVLTAPDGNRVDILPAVSLFTGISYGRTTTGLGYFAQPTPRAANTTTSHERLVAPPVFSREGGMYVTSMMLTLSAEPGAQIHYTTDGTVPRPGISPVYSAPINLSGSYSSMRIRAIATRGNDLKSDVVTHTYARVSSTIPNWSSDLPIVVLMQHNLPITPGDKTPASMILIDRESDGRARLAGPATLHTRIDADIRGSSSQTFPQKMYGVELRTEWNGNRDEDLLGMPADHNWIFYAPYGEKTLMRNVLAYQLSENMGHWAPRTRFVELFLHSGTGSVSQSHYAGVYVIVERIKPGEHRVDIDPMTPSDDTGGYIIRKDRIDSGESGFRPVSNHQMAFYRPSETELTLAQRNIIRDDVNRFENALYGSNYRDPSEGYAAYIETDSFIDHFLITEYLKEIDGYRLSTFLHKDRGGKLVMGPVWDFNLTAGNADFVNGWIPTGWYHIDLQNNCYWDCGIRNWYTRLLTDPDFVEKMRYRWWELRRGAFSAEAINGMISSYAQEVAEAQVRHYQKWPILGVKTLFNYYVGPTYDSEVTWMRDWLMSRMTWMDAQMGTPPEVVPFRTNRFWHFGTSVPNDQPLIRIDATFPTGSDAYLEFKSALAGYPFTNTHPDWRKASMERRNAPTSVNYSSDAMGGSAYDSGAMRGVQIKQPFRGNAGENELIAHVPTTGSSGIRLAFAVKDEGAADRLLIDYSVTSGAPVWVTSGLNTSVFALDEDYQRIEVDFSTIEEVDDNPDFKIRIRFDGDHMTDDHGNRVTFNNLSVDAKQTTVGIDDGHQETPKRFELEQNVPNPFNPETEIGYRKSEIGPTLLTVYDTLGRRVAVLVDGVQDAGRHTVRFDAKNVASGVYVYRLESGGQVQTRKMVLVK